MKSYLFMTAIVVLSLSAVALAQDRAIQPDVEAAIPSQPDSQKVPIMVVREAPDKPKTDVVVSGKAGILSAKAGGANSTGKPLVMGGGVPTSFSLEATTGNPEYDRLVLESATRNSVDPALMVEVMRQESGFNARAHSYKGACGLMQLMPGTAARFGVTKIFDPAQNIEAGAKYLRFLLDKFDGDVQLTLAGYNAGEGAVVEAGYRVPRYRETQAYVHTISSRYGAAEKSVRGKAPVQAVANKPMVIPSGPSGTLSNNY